MMSNGSRTKKTVSRLEEALQLSDQLINSDSNENTKSVVMSMKI